MENSPGYRPALHWYAVALSAATYLLLFAGGMVTSTNSGLAVPDWPTTFGQNMFTFPPSMMKGGIFYEHGHRLFASLVGFLTIGICLAFWMWERRRWLRLAGTGAIALVIVQGVLGGITVRYKLPMPVSAAHACTAELFFLLTVLMAFATSRPWLSAAPAAFRWQWPQALSLAFTGAVFLQIMAGAVMRHSYAGLAIPTFPKAYGAALPPFWNFPIAINFLHTRFGALLVAALGAWLAARLLLSRTQRGAVKALAASLAGAIALQCALGMFAVWSGKAAVPTTLHLSGGALVFAAGFMVFLSVSRWSPRAPDAKEEPRAAAKQRPHSQQAPRAKAALS